MCREAGDSCLWNLQVRVSTSLCPACMSGSLQFCGSQGPPVVSASTESGPNNHTIYIYIYKYIDLCMGLELSARMAL